MIQKLTKYLKRTNTILKDNIKIEFTPVRQKLLSEQFEQWEKLENDSKKNIKKNTFFTQPDFFDCL